ncbi:MAG: hypothetical protein PHU56_04165 [Candidatus Pacebacteria bacterium]|nr:hypothetical protein [Candidatus Paceibacterota bacterium]
MLEERENSFGQARAEEEKKTSIKGIFETFRERMMDKFDDFLATLLIKEDCDFARFEKSLRKSSDLSQAGGEFFRFLVERYPTRKDVRPGKRYDEKDRIRDLFKDYLEKNSFPGEKDERKKIRNFILGIHDLKNNPARGRIRKTDWFFTEEGQWRSNLYLFDQKNSPNLIREDLINFYSPKKNANAVISDLVIINRENGKSLALNSLLPEGYNFCPFSVLHSEEKNDQDNLGPSSGFKPAGIDNYRGNEMEKEADFLASSDLHKVYYGNLTEKGGILCLLHEISHCWMDEGFDNFSRLEFDDFCQEFYRVLYFKAMLMHFQEIKKLENIPDYLIRAGFEGAGLESAEEEANEVIRQMGMKVSQAPSESRPLSDSEFMITMSPSGKPVRLIVESQRLNELLEQFSKSERDAWAYAIRVLRYLRRKGFDLEPNFNTMDDFRGLVDKALRDYKDDLFLEHPEIIKEKKFFFKGSLDRKKNK